MQHKQLTMLVPACLLIFAFAGCGNEEPLAAPWTPVIQTKVTQPARMAAFLDETFGVTGGFSGAGKAHVTTDGGKTWTMSESSGGCLFGIDILDRQRVWVCGRVAGVSFSTPGGIRLSRDGGRTFEPRTDINTLPKAAPMNFIDEKTGWYFRTDTLYRTADGGKTWDKLPLPKEAETIKAVAIRSADEGYLVDAAGRFFSTRDAGGTWEAVRLPFEKIHASRISDMESVTAAIRFFDGERGMVIAGVLTDGTPKAKVIAFRTANGGVDWQPELVVNGLGTVFLSPDGRYLTFNNAGNITVLKYAGDAAAE